MGARIGVPRPLGVRGAAATGLATGGLAIPATLAMAAAGAGVGAAVGAAGGACGVAETKHPVAGHHRVALSHERFDRVTDAQRPDRRAVAVDEHVPPDLLQQLADAHHGEPL